VKILTVFNRKKINFSVLISLAQSLGDVTRCGIPITDAFEIVEQTLENSYHRGIIREIRNGVKKGNSISKSMEEVKAFPAIFIEMILIGENTGNLQDVFQSLAKFYKNINNITKKSSNAIIYPVILIVLLVIAASVMFIFLLPQFSELYESMGIVPKGIAGKVIALRNGFDKNILVATAFVISYVFILPYIIFIKAFRNYLIKHIMKIRVFSQYIEYYIIEILELIFKSGVNVQNTILQFCNEINIPIIKEKILFIYENLKNGTELSSALEKMDGISFYSISFIKIGEETGTLSERLKLLAEEKEKQITENTEVLSSIIQPMLILIISSFILGLFMIFLLPVYDGVKL